MAPAVVPPSPSPSPTVAVVGTPPTPSLSVDGYEFSTHLLFDRAYGMHAADAAHASGLEGVGLMCSWTRTGSDVSNALELFGSPTDPSVLAGYPTVTRGTTGGRTGGFPVAAANDATETHVVCGMRDPSGDHGVEVVVFFARQGATTVISQAAFNPWRR